MKIKQTRVSVALFARKNDHWDDATNAARDIALAQPEPGCYYIFGVYLRN